MRYALLVYSNVEVRDQTPDEARRRINAGIAAVLERPNVSGWLRLQPASRRRPCTCESAQGRC